MKAHVAAVLLAVILVPAAASAEVISLNCGGASGFKVDVDTDAKSILIIMYPKTTPFKMPPFTNVQIGDDTFVGDMTYLDTTRHVEISRRTGVMHTTYPGKDMHTQCTRWTG